ncbi:MAG TPA: phosphatase PAP2 family protein [Sphingomicrobium sp.]|jgi:undecaprenyl-diphosphatase|nr:phosphatase PAP2 family protein [Sphingomicrobium sp.]
MLPSFVRNLDRNVLIAFLALVLLLAGVGNLASDVVEGDTLAFDRWLIERLRDPADPASPVGPAWLKKAMLDLTALGGGSFLTVLTLGTAGFLMAARKWGMAVFVVVAIASGALAANLLKWMFVRARPDLVPHLVSVDSASFPSAHAMNSAVTFLTLGVLLSRTQKDSRLKIYLMATAVILTLIVGFSRVYLGVHWPTDVLAGWAVGAAWAIFCSIIAAILQRRAAIEREGETSAPPSQRT